MKRVDVKPLTHWIIYRGYKVRFTQRQPGNVTGVLTTPVGELTFAYDPDRRIVQLPHEQIQINEYGWELGQESAA
jgi:hypothetical protein